VRGGTVELSSAQWRGAVTSALAGTHGFTLGFPRWLNERPATLSLGVPLRLDGMISDLFFESGFARFDGRGRTILARDAVLALPLPLSPPPYRLSLRLAALRPTTVTLSVEGGADQAVEVGPGETDVAIDIPPGAVSSDALTRIRLRRQEVPEVNDPKALAVVGVNLHKV
jgi:hypothetical protein